MSDDIPPSNAIDENPEGLGTVPIKRDQPAQPGAVPPVGGGRPDRTTNTGPVTTGEPDILSGPTPARTAKPVIIGLSVAAAGLAAFSGYGMLQAKEDRRLLAEASANATALETRKQDLESDLKDARSALAAATKAQEDAIASKDREIELASANAREANEKLANEKETSIKLQAKVDEAYAAVQALENLERELVSLRTTTQELEAGKAKAEAEVLRLTVALASPTTPPPSSGPTPAPRPTADEYEEAEKPIQRPQASGLAWVRLGKYETGPNKGRWYFVAPDGFISPLYRSREIAVQQAELRAGFRQPDLKPEVITYSSGK